MSESVFNDYKHCMRSILGPEVSNALMAHGPVETKNPVVRTHTFVSVSKISAEKVWKVGRLSLSCAHCNKRTVNLCIECMYFRWTPRCFPAVCTECGGVHAREYTLIQPGGSKNQGPVAKKSRVFMNDDRSACSSEEEDDGSHDGSEGGGSSVECVGGDREDRGENDGGAEAFRGGAGFGAGDGDRGSEVGAGGGAFGRGRGGRGRGGRGRGRGRGRGGGRGSSRDGGSEALGTSTGVVGSSAGAGDVASACAAVEGPGAAGIGGILVEDEDKFKDESIIASLCGENELYTRIPASIYLAGKPPGGSGIDGFEKWLENVRLRFGIFSISLDQFHEDLLQPKSFWR
jgi:hypothetical protein